MKKKCAVFLTTILGVFSPSLIITNPVSAQTAETQQILNDYNSMINDASQLANYLEQQQQQQMNALSSSCSGGNQSACNELNYMLDQQIKAQENSLKRSRIMWQDYTDSIRDVYD